MSDHMCWTQTTDYGKEPWTQASRLGTPRTSTRHGWPEPSPVMKANRRADWPLTSRETEVLAAMAAGKTNAAVAEFLFISRKAVEKHVNSIFSKLLLNAQDEQHPRVAAVLLYLNHISATTQQMDAPHRRAALHHSGANRLRAHRRRRRPTPNRATERPD